MNINLKYCIKCGRAFDVGTNHDICFKCREIKQNKKEGKRDGRKIIC